MEAKRAVQRVVGSDRRLQGELHADIERGKGQPVLDFQLVPMPQAEQEDRLAQRPSLGRSPFKRELGPGPEPEPAGGGDGYTAGVGDGYNW